MPNYKYIAKDKNGKTISGIAEAKDRAAMVDLIRGKDLAIIALEEQAKPAGRALQFFMKGRKVKLEDLVIFSRQLATMVDAGIPLVSALDILSEQVDNKELRQVIVNVRNDVEAGASLSDAISKHKNAFSALYVNMVKAGEASGMLDDILERLAEYLEKTSSLQRKVTSALVYPAIVSSMAIAITLLLLIKVIPIFKTIFEGFGAALPVPTMVLITISDFLRKYFLFIAVGVIIAMIIARKYIKTEKGRLWLDSTMLGMPIFGVLFKKVAISKFTRTLSTLLKSGVSILAALEIVSKTSGNKVVEKAIDNVRNNVKEGESISEPLMKAKVFPPMVTRMVAVGEKAGELEKMLSKIADFYDEQVDAAVTALTSMIEPLIIAFLGIVIGSIVICMFLPIFKITAVMGM